jgi:hypothetical protein
MVDNDVRVTLHAVTYDGETYENVILEHMPASGEFDSYGWLSDRISHECGMIPVAPHTWVNIESIKKLWFTMEPRLTSREI